MQEALARVLRFGFEELDLHRIEAKYITENERSRHVMEKAGMVKSGQTEEIQYRGKTCRCIIIAAISAFAGISFTSCAEYIWFYPRVMFVFWIVLGVLLAAVRCGKKNSLSD